MTFTSYGRVPKGSAAAHRELVAACRSYVVMCGAWEVKILGGLGQRPGLPDIISCFPPRGRLVAIECKTGEQQLTDKQDLEREAIEDARGLYLLVRGLDELEMMLLSARLLDQPRLTTLADQGTWASRHGRGARSRKSR